MNLKDKVIIVTGGSGLIGNSILEHTRKNGAIAINADIKSLSIDKSFFEFCDITDEISIQKMIDIVFQKYGRIDGLVNNAYPRTSDWGNKFEDITLDSWRKNVDMQLNSTFLLIQKVSEIMKKQKKGSIVNVASIYGIVGNDFTVYENTGGMTSPAAYSAIKGGMINFSRYLASYLGEYSIRVNCVSPGGIFNNQNHNFVTQFSNKVPLKRMGLPNDISPSISFLLSDESEYITGHNLVVDGGWTAI